MEERYVLCFMEDQHDKEEIGTRTATEIRSCSDREWRGVYEIYTGGSATDGTEREGAVVMVYRGSDERIW